MVSFLLESVELSEVADDAVSVAFGFASTLILMSKKFTVFLNDSLNLSSYKQA